MLSLQEMFVDKGWDTSYIAYTGAFITIVVLAGIYRYLRDDNSSD